MLKILMQVNNKNIRKIETDKEMIQKSCIKISKLKRFFKLRFLRNAK